MTSGSSVGVAGAGAWGLALANAAAAAGSTVVLWGRNAEAMAALQATRLSDSLPGVRLAQAVEATGDLDRLAGSAAILVATPAQATREAAGRLAQLPGSAPLVTCAKGIERGSHAFMTEVLRAAAPDPRRGDPVGAFICRRRRCRPADRGNPRLRRRGARPFALPPAAWAQPAPLPFDRRPRRRNRRRGQERARDRLRRRHRTPPRPERVSGAGRPRLCGTAPVWRRLRRPRPDADGTFRPGRPRADLLVGSVAQLRFRPGAGTGRERRRGASGANSPRAPSRLWL